MREFLKHHLTKKKRVFFKVVAYGRWPLTESGRYETVDCITDFS